ncbi:MAG: alpha/beta fold hydrolase, partial [Sneathiella sp.]
MIVDHDLDVASSLGIKPFRAKGPWWSGDLQTLRNRILRPGTPIPGQSKRVFLDLNDGTSDKLWAMLDAPDISNDTPLVVLVHGLTGSEDSDYMRCSTAFFLQQKYRVLRLNLRGAGPSINQCVGHYHSGCADDIHMALNALPADLLDRGVFMIGFSLGGNILIHLLANCEPAFEIKGAVTISASIDPAGAARRLMAPRNALYQKWLLKQMAHECLATRSYIA